MQLGTCKLFHEDMPLDFLSRPNDNNIIISSILAPQLIPTDDSARSLKVLEFHRRLDDVNMGVLTYGSAVHEDLTHMSRVPYLGRKHMKSNNI